MNSQPKPPNKLTSLLVFTLTLIALIFFGAHNYTLYAAWTACIILIVLYSLSTSTHPYLKSISLKITLLCSSWTIYALFLTPTVHSPTTHINLLIITITYTLASVLITKHIFSRSQPHEYLWKIIALLTIVQSVAAIATFPFDTNRATGTYYNPNTLATVSCFSFLYFTTIGNKKKKVSNTFLAFCTAILTLFSGSTKGVVGLFIVILLTTFLSKSNTQRLLTTTALAVCTLLSIFVSTTAIDRLLTKTESISSGLEATTTGSTEERAFLILESLRIIRNFPLTGVGVHNSQFYLYTPKYYILQQRGTIPAGAPGVYSHNNYTEMCLNGGIPAFLLYYTPIAYLLFQLLKLKKKEARYRTFIAFSISAIALKLFFDLAMVSYYSFIHIFIVTLCYKSYFVYSHHIPLPKSSRKSRNESVRIDV